jgi:hypothetical protein
MKQAATLFRAIHSGTFNAMPVRETSFAIAETRAITVPAKVVMATAATNADLQEESLGAIRDWVGVMLMSRSVRNDIASATAALCPASLGSFFWLAFTYFSSRPTEPNTELGLTQRLSNHGSYVYLSNTESTGMVLLMMAFFAGLLATLIFVPKDPILPPPGTPKWITFVGGSAKTDLANPTPRLKVIFLCSLAFYLSVIWFAGPAISSLAVSQGVVLHV